MGECKNAAAKGSHKGIEMDTELTKLLEQTDATGGASPEAIEELLEYASTGLPRAYLDFLRTRNGAEGPVGENGYVALYAAEDIQRMNDGYQVSRFAPGLLLIGSDGGGSAFAIDTRPGDPEAMEYVEVPFIPLDVDEIEFRAESLTALLQHIADTEPSDIDYPEPPPFLDKI